MIKGLYEAHLPVSNIERSIAFNESLGLELAQRSPKTAFFWIEKGKSWLGLWECTEVNTAYHPSLRHIALTVDFTDLKKAISWLEERGIIAREDFGFKPLEPIVMPAEKNGKSVGHAMIYFNDPDGNSIEFICNLPEGPKDTGMMYLSEWEKLQKQKIIDIKSFI